MVICGYIDVAIIGKKLGNNLLKRLDFESRGRFFIKRRFS